MIHRHGMKSLRCVDLNLKVESGREQIQYLFTFEILGTLKIITFRGSIPLCLINRKQGKDGRFTYKNLIRIFLQLSLHIKCNIKYFVKHDTVTSGSCLFYSFVRQFSKKGFNSVVHYFDFKC